MRKIRRILALLAALTLCASAACAEEPETPVSFLPMVSNWILDDMPLELTVSADVTAYAPFDEERLPQLSNLLKHLALRVTWQPLMGETQSTVSVLVDGLDALTLGQQASFSGTMLQLSSLPGVTYLGDNPAAALLGTSVEAPTLYGLDGSESAWLTEGFALLNGCQDALKPYLTEEVSVQTNIKDMGTAAVRQDYTVSKDDAASLPLLLADVCPEGRLKELIARLTFSGKQTLRVYRREDGVALRMEWKGKCGTDADHLRDVTLTWRLRRDGTAYRDELSLKSPAVSGSDRNTLSWNCVIQPDKKGQLTMKGDFSYATTLDKQKTSLSGSFDLTNAAADNDSHITGTAVLERQLPGEDETTSLSFAPDLYVAGDANIPVINGDVTVTEKRGKNVENAAVLSLRLTRTGYTSWQMRDVTVDLSLMTEEELAAAREEVAQSVAAALLVRLLRLPREDLDYLLHDLPEDTVQMLIDAAQSGS